MKQTFTITGKLPGMNEYTAAQRNNKYGGASLKKAAQKAVEVHIMASRLKPIDRPVYIRYLFCEPNRRRDKDNIAGFAHKVIQDALVSCGILKDDAWDYITGYEDRFGIDKKHPHIDVELRYEK